MQRVLSRDKRGNLPLELRAMLPGLHPCHQPPGGEGGTPLLRGRDFAGTDTAGSHRVAIVSQAFVERYLPKIDPIGKTITFDFGGQKRFQHEIVGVAKEARQVARCKAGRFCGRI